MVNSCEFTLFTLARKKRMDADSYSLRARGKK